MRSEQTLATQIIARMNRFSLINWTRSSLFIFIALFIFSSACTNIGGKVGAASSEVVQSDPSLGTNVGAFKLVTVLPSQASAGTSYDMIGENGEFDTFCSGTYGVCKCEYSYTLSGGSTETQEGNVTYQESNLLRCANAVQSGINAFNVRIIIEAASGTTTSTSSTTTSSYSSNSIGVNLSSGSFAGSDSFLDLSNAQSFVPVNRFQCRRRSFIPNPLDNNIIDPIQSEDPRIIYPFNFYTTNPSEGLLQMQRLNSQQWECTLTATQDRSLHWWANPYVYSASACVTGFCAGDSELMYPTTTLASGKVPVSNTQATGKRRASFSVASRSYGVFQIPIQAAVAPKDFVSGTYSVIGYGAKPIPNASSSSSCPNIPLPPKATWVKVWNYRSTDIHAPTYVTTSPLMEKRGIVCNPKAGTFPSCDVTTTSTSGATFGTNLVTMGTNPTPGTLSSRVVALSSDLGTANACYNVDSRSITADYPAGAEFWLPSMFGFTNTVPASSVTGLPWGLYSSITNNCQGTDNVWRYSMTGCSSGGSVGNPNAAPTPGVPIESQFTTAALADDANDVKDFSDQMFVVTDPNVDDHLMTNQSLSVSQYKPVTYRSSMDCNTSSRVNCPAQKELHWDINVKAVGSSTGSDIYPLCVLQFYD